MAGSEKTKLGVDESTGPSGEDICASMDGGAQSALRSSRLVDLLLVFKNSKSNISSFVTLNETK
jgi:hypothetical protein